MFDSLVSFVYNVGQGNFKNSQLLKLLNQGKYEESAEEFDKWRLAKGKVVKGLIRRRQKEKEMFLSGLCELQSEEGLNESE
jgi:GH24 family phage-related lysozyme (muramidase)